MTDAYERAQKIHKGCLAAMLRDIESVGSHVRLARIPHGLRRTAREIGVSPTTLSRLENGGDISQAVLIKVKKWAQQRGSDD